LGDALTGKRWLYVPKMLHLICAFVGGAPAFVLSQAHRSRGAFKSQAGSAQESVDGAGFAGFRESGCFRYSQGYGRQRLDGGDT
jgi:hypothetical protein